MSSIVATKIKLSIPNIINPDQTAFIADRFIGENTCLINDIIHQCKRENKEAFMVVVDFTRAFDTLEWSFIEYSLRQFNFGG